MTPVTSSAPFVMRRTPFYNLHVESGGTLCPWQGMEISSHFGSILDEHRSLNEGLGVFDLGYRSFFRLDGPGSTPLLDRAFAQSVGMLSVGGLCQRILLQPDGLVADLVTVCREADNTWLLVLQDSNASWLPELLHGISTDGEYYLEDLSKQYAWAGLAGTRVREFLSCASPEAEALGCGQKTEVLVSGVAVHLWRLKNNYFQMACQPELLEKIIRSWWIAESQPVLCGFASYENWRLENGELRHGLELTRNATPFELGLDSMVELDRDYFPARDALVGMQHKDLEHLLVHFTLDATRIPRSQSPVFCGEEKVGVVCAGGFSPSVKCPMGSAWIRTANVDFDELKVELRRQRYDLRIKKFPLK